MLLWLLVRKIEWINLRAAFNHARLDYILLAILLVLPNVTVQFLKWRFLLRLTKSSVTNFEVLSSLLVGFTLGFISPGRIGEFGRALFITDCSRLRIVGLTLIDKIFAMLVVFVIGAFGLFFIMTRKSGSMLIWLLGGLVLAAVVLAMFLLFFPEYLRAILQWFQPFLPFKKHVTAFLSSLEPLNRKRAVQCFGWNVLFYLIITSQFYLLISAFEKLPLIITYLAIFCIFITKSLLPISFGDLGVRETATVFFVSLIGGEKTTGFNASILIFLINLAFPSFIGFLWLFIPKIQQQFLALKKEKSNPC